MQEKQPTPSRAKDSVAASGASNQPPRTSDRGLVNETASATKRSAADFLRPAQGAVARWREKAWFYLRIWVPFFANPAFRARTIVYDPRESRVGMVWRLTLPAVCHACGREDRLSDRLHRFQVRGFEYPLEIAIGSAVVGLMLLWIAATFESVTMLAAAIVSLALGPVLLRFKSWPEKVEAAIWSCEEHAAGASAIDGVVYHNELSLVLPSDRAAEAARAELVAARRRYGRYAGDGNPSPSTSETLPPKASFSPPKPPPPPGGAPKPAAAVDNSGSTAPFGGTVPPPRVELPPIKLDDD